MADEKRREHPHHMHDAILAQPDAFARAVRRNEELADDFALYGSRGRTFRGGCRAGKALD